MFKLRFISYVQIEYADAIQYTSITNRLKGIVS